MEPEVTPEQEAEILGNEPPKETPSQDSKATPVGGKDKPVTPPGQEPPTEEEIKFDERQQAHVDKIIKERLERDRQGRALPPEIERELQESRAFIREQMRKSQSTPPREDRGPQIPKSPDDVTDVGEFLGMPEYKGFSMAVLKEKHPDHYAVMKPVVMTEIRNLDRFAKFEQQKQGSEQEQQYQTWLMDQVKNLRTAMGDQAGNFFTPDGKLTSKFKVDFADWGVQHGIYNPLLAYQLKDPATGKPRNRFFTEEELKTHVGKEVTEALKKIGKEGPPPRVDDKGGKPPKVEAVTEAMDEDALMKIYGDEKPGWEKAHEILKKRGVL